MKKSLLTLILFLLFFSLSNAGQYEFKVIAVKGKALYNTGSGSWKNIKTGTKIYPNYNVKLEKKSYLGLIHKTGKTLELKTKGKWTCKDLSQKIQGTASSITNKLSNYILAQLNEDENGNYDYRETMGTTGAVERSLNPAAVSGTTTFVQLKSPRKINFTDNTATFVWQKVNDENEYVFTITDRFDRIVHTKIVKGNKYTINADDLNLKKDDYYFWRVACSNDRTIKSPDCAFCFFYPESLAKIEKDYEKLVSEIGGEDSALNQIVIGNFFEMNYLMNRALKHYKKAVQLEPSVQEYQNIYTNFLQRLNH
jgi:hypothetical protein